MNNRSKMYRSNSKIKKHLESLGFENFYFFPHLRFQKDYTFEGCGFDAFAWKDGKIWFFQLKTNLACPKKELEKYKKIEENYLCIPCWVSSFDRKSKSKKRGVVMYNNNVK